MMLISKSSIRNISWSKVTRLEPMCSSAVEVSSTNSVVFENDDLGTEELWHRDLEDRTIEILEDTDWQIQLDNCLPTSLNESIFIPRHHWHRVIKGNGNLKLKIHLD